MKKLLFLLVLGGLAYAGFQTYSVHSHAESIKKQATAIIDEYQVLKGENKDFKVQSKVLRAEQRRCTEYTNQDSGDFSEFEYCKKYLDLVKDFDLEE